MAYKKVKTANKVAKTPKNPNYDRWNDGGGAITNVKGGKPVKLTDTQKKAMSKKKGKK